VTSFAVVRAFMRGVELTPEQLAEFRAISALFYTRSAALDQRDSDTEQRALLDSVVWRLREMLTEGQREPFDHNVAEWRAGR
jgi:hypothetical protein